MEYRRAAGARRVGRNARRARGRKQAERKGDVRMKKTKLAALFLALAMLIAAMITIVPICLAVMAVLALAGYFFIVR